MLPNNLRYFAFVTKFGPKMTPLSKSPFSRHFIALTFFGAWIIDTKDPIKANLFVVYRLLITVLLVWHLYGLFVDLHSVLGDMKKMSWNLCVTILILGTISKNYQMVQRRQTINHLRLMLHRDAESRQKPEDIVIHDLAVKELKLLRFSFYSSAFVFIPAWLFSKYSKFAWGVRELPIPFQVPDIFDLENDFHFHVLFIFLGGAGIFGTFLAIETELSMYGLLIQISREYRVLQKDIRLIDRIYDDDDDNSGCLGNKEVNYCLKRHKTKMMLKMFCVKQSTLIQYTKAFESCFSQPLLQEFLGISILILTLALQCLWGSANFPGNILYQSVYLLIITVNIFLICLFSTRLRTQCLEVGETAYSTLWYKMGVETQKDMAMIIMRSQHPPKITIGEFIELNLNVFMNMMSNLYGWLALFLQLEASTSV